MLASPSCPVPCHFLRRLPRSSKCQSLPSLQHPSCILRPPAFLSVNWPHSTLNHAYTSRPICSLPFCLICVPFALPDSAPDRTSAQSTISEFCPAPLGVFSPFSSVSFPTCFLILLVPSDFHCNCTNTGTNDLFVHPRTGRDSLQR